MIVFPLLIFGLFHITGNKANLSTRRLYNDVLFKRNVYNDFHARPVHNFTQPVVLYMNLSLTQILEVDEKNQMIDLNMWVYQEWKDPNFHWSPEYYDYVNEILVPQEELWKPDLVLYNNAGGDWDLASSASTKVHIYSDSQVVWKPPIIFKATCEIDVEFFPFDTQRCKLKMGTWSYDGLKIDLRHTAQKEYDKKNKPEQTNFDKCESNIDYAIDIDSYQDHVEWDLLEVSAQRNIKNYTCCPEPFIDITYTIAIRRRTVFYGINLICPCMAISFLTIMSFYLPSDSQEKMSLSISVLIALTVFIMLVFELTPSTSRVVPLVTKYLLFTLLLVTASILVSIFVLNIRYQSPENHPIPSWVRNSLIETLPKYLFFIKQPKEKASANLKYIANRYMIIANFENEDEGDMMLNSKLRQRRAALPQSNAFQIQMAFDGLRNIARYMHKESVISEVTEDWKFVGLVLDRVFLIFFGLAVLIGTVGIFSQAPTLNDSKQGLLAEMAKKLQSTVNYTRNCTPTAANIVS